MRRKTRLLAAAAAAAALLTGAFTVTPALAAEEPISQGKPVTTSTDEFGWSAGANAVDGDSGTRWSSTWADGQWISIDLGSVQAVDRVSLEWEAAYASGYRIEVSDDGAGWTSIYSTMSSPGGNEVLDVDGTGRFVRLVVTERATQYGVSLWEFQVFGAGDEPPPTGGDVLLSYGKQGSASSQQHDGNCWECSPDKAFDMDPASRWATDEETGWTDEGWIAVDLGASAHVSSVVLQWDPAYAASYDIDVSDDGSTWTTVHSTTTGAGFKETIPLDADGRHVRVHMTDRSGPYGYSLWEFQVYGTGGAPTAPPADPADPDFDDLELVWSDEFDGAAGTPADGSKWTVDPGLPANNELQYYTPEGNGSHDGQGHFVIEARQEASGGQAYTSHRMNTSNKFHAQYGRFESRIKVPEGRGFWPAFWMMGTDFLEGRPWPYNGEVDIMEFIGQEPYEAHSTLHAPAYSGAGGYGGSYELPDGSKISDGFHTFAAEWDSKGIRYFLDGREVFYAEKSTVESTRGPWIYDHEFYMILNLAVGGDWPGPPDAQTPFPSEMVVDYVRVYQ